MKTTKGTYKLMLVDGKPRLFLLSPVKAQHSIEYIKNGKRTTTTVANMIRLLDLSNSYIQEV